MLGLYVHGRNIKRERKGEGSGVGRRDHTVKEIAKNKEGPGLCFIIHAPIHILCVYLPLFLSVSLSLSLTHTLNKCVNKIKELWYFFVNFVFHFALTLFALLVFCLFNLCFSGGVRFVSWVWFPFSEERKRI